MKKLEIRELAEVIQSSNLNFLFGAGLSRPFLPVLGDIEKRLNEAEEDAKEAIHKEYFEKVMLPNKGVINGTESSTNYQETKTSYEEFCRVMSEILLKRKSTILSKQANIFTTNVDVLLETALERLQLEYNDGFSGRFNPLFGIENYKKSIQQRSLHFDHISEIPVFNVVKIHGSLTWKYRDASKEEIELSPRLEHFDDSLSSKSGEAFSEDYKELLVVNPEEAKHLVSVLNVYYSELLRLYSSELEKENAVLFVMGFSMEDKHIKEITLRAAKSNPTLRIYIFCYSKKKKVKDEQRNEVEIDCKLEMEKKMEVEQHPNIQVIAPEDDEGENKLSLKKITQSVFDGIWKTRSKQNTSSSEETAQSITPEVDE